MWWVIPQTRQEWIPSLDVAYTFQANAKKGVMGRMKDIVNGDAIAAKIYAVFSKLGFETLAYLPAKESSTLATIEKYVKFKQGEVWQDITSDFEREDLKPTGSDRARLQSGIQKAEMIARDVVEAQTILHTKHMEVCITCYNKSGLSFLLNHHSNKIER